MRRPRMRNDAVVTREALAITLSDGRFLSRYSGSFSNCATPMAADTLVSR